MTVKISFINTLPVPIDPPISAKFDIPQWYKDQESYIGGFKRPEFPQGSTPSTVKKCIPVFDSITSGYIIKTHVDLYITQQEDGTTFFQWKDLDALSFQTKDQVGLHPQATGYDIPKFNNPWAIKTPKGYSTMFLPPMHRENVINILPGVVDTDSYVNPVAFPFTLSNPTFEGLIPAGTSIVQVIPFKRDVWKSESVNKTLEVAKISTKLQSVWFDGYKQFFWSKKEYN